MDTNKETNSILTVTELTHAIKKNLEGSFPAFWLQGEVSNCKLHSSGHLYFSLKDSGAQIAAVMFRGHASTLGKPLNDGDKVVVYGGINVFAPSGRYQIQVLELRFAGVGELLLRLEELKRKLHKKGWFSKERKKPLPKMPRKIGIVTSPTGAVIQDILNVLTRRFSGFHVILNPVRVQGEGAAQEIAQAIRQFNETNLVDVMIIGRGGGSIEDLWAFNEEIVAEAIYESKIPIIAAVGHETDHCIAEYVADVRAPTPSAAAELVIAEKAQQVDKLIVCRKRMDHLMAVLVRHLQSKLKERFKHPLFQNPYHLIGPWMQKMDHMRQRYDQEIANYVKQQRFALEARKKLLESLTPGAQIKNFKIKLALLEKQIDVLMQRKLAIQEERLDRVTTSLKAIDPKNLLKQGYSILFSEKKRSIINSVNQVKESDKVRIVLADGELLSEILEVVPKS